MKSKKNLNLKNLPKQKKKNSNRKNDYQIWKKKNRGWNWEKNQNKKLSQIWQTKKLKDDEIKKILILEIN
jgi:hypothetical protein